MKVVCDSSTLISLSRIGRLDIIENTVESLVIPMTQDELEQTISRMVERIVAQFQPERVILFGSHARGTASPDSDVDLLVVMSVAGSKRAQQLDIRLAMNEFKVPKDIIVTTPEDFEWRKEIPGTVERPASLEGKVLYART